MNLADRCQRIELILSDVDGVMTDGGIRMLDDGRQIITFHIRDGMGVRLWREYSDGLARKTFRFSLIHLSVLFAALLVDHYLI